MEQELGIVKWIWLIPLLPFLAAGLTALMRKEQRQPAQALVIGAMSISFLLSCCMLAKVLTHSHGEETFRKVVNFVWFTSGAATHLELGFVLDSLSALMLIVVSLVGLVIFIFSIGYMDEDENAARFFTFLSLFAGSMLGLVIANSLLLLFMFWELVGLSSYILIGFWYFKPSAAAAAKKAFIVTRVGDIGFFFGLLMLFYATGTSILFNQVASGAIQTAGLHRIEAVGILHESFFGLQLAIPFAVLLALMIFCGAAGKSGQFPLHVWLPDAMEGPTPVSALIHAATMVAAGVFLVARMYPVFELHGGDALKVVAIIGAFTALMAAVIGCAQFDIKRILAYSTVSQLGYMMMALGVGGYVAGMFHLFTHAFFKALLFLGAGSIIHACHHEQDIRNMGGLLKKMPVTAWSYLIGTGALCGIFPLAGFWSKDDILLDAFYSANVPYNIPFFFGTAAAILTAFYMTRQCIYVFFGEMRGSHLHPHESRAVMTIPLCLLAGASVLVGVLYGWPSIGGAKIHHFLAPERSAPPFQWRFAAVMMLPALVGILAGYLVYWRSRSRLKGLEPMEKLLGASGFAPIYRAIQNKFYFDEIYDATVVAFNGWLARAADIVDRIVIDGLIWILGVAVRALSILSQWMDDSGINRGFDEACEGIRDASASNRAIIQTGALQRYLKFLAAGVAVLFLILVLL